MTVNNENNLVELFAGSPIDAEIVKSILNDSEIVSYLKDEYMGTIAPWHTSPGGTGSVKVIISDSDFTRAKLIIDEYIKNIK